jgi:hypothetical protein
VLANVLVLDGFVGTVGRVESAKDKTF